MKTQNPYYPSHENHREKLLIGGTLAVIAFCLAGSVWGISEIHRLNHETRCLEAAANYYRTIRECHEAAFEARHNPDHPARGLVALADAIATNLDARMTLATAGGDE